jgi:hypothetical protein
MQNNQQHPHTHYMSMMQRNLHHPYSTSTFNLHIQRQHYVSRCPALGIGVFTRILKVGGTAIVRGDACF